jgi:hypothetical protein
LSTSIEWCFCYLLRMADARHTNIHLKICARTVVNYIPFVMCFIFALLRLPGSRIPMALQSTPDDPEKIYPYIWFDHAISLRITSAVLPIWPRHVCMCRVRSFALGVRPLRNMRMCSFRRCAFSLWYTLHIHRFGCRLSVFSFVPFCSYPFSNKLKTCRSVAELIHELSKSNFALRSRASFGILYYGHLSFELKRQMYFIPALCALQQRIVLIWLSLYKSLRHVELRRRLNFL